MAFTFGVDNKVSFFLHAGKAAWLANKAKNRFCGLTVVQFMNASGSYTPLGGIHFWGQLEDYLFSGSTVPWHAALYISI